MTDSTATIAEFLDATAARTSTPGGGAVAAVAGGLAAAMAEMVLAFSVDKKDLADHRPELMTIADGLRAARDELLGLLTEDQLAFVEMTAAKKSGEPARIGGAVAAAIRVPQRIAEVAVMILSLCERATPIANKWLLSDLAVSAELATATARAAACNVRVNLPSMIAGRDDAAAVSDLSTSDAVTLVRRVMPRIWARLDGA